MLILFATISIHIVSFLENLNFTLHYPFKVKLVAVDNLKLFLDKHFKLKESNEFTCSSFLRNKKIVFPQVLCKIVN